LRKSYGTRMVVDGLDLDVPAGEIVGLIGANGAGKTTTVECIQGLRKPDGGRLRVLGLDPVTQAEQLRPLVGSQLQSSALPDRLRVAEALDLFSTPRARDGGELLEQFGLTQRRRSVFSSLSGGERQRLFLVLALLNRPRLVILDELTQGLDPAARRNVWAAIRQLNDEGTTVLLVTHEMDEAEALCDRVAVMRAGHVIDAGAPADLVERHASTAVIRFSMPDPPAQLLDQVRRLDGVGEVTRSGARITVRGHRRIVAHVCAALVRWEPVPADLVISQPGLEDALLGLLNGDHGEQPVACALLLAVAAPVYGIPAVHDAWRVAVALPLGAVAFVSIGVLLGSVLPSARAAQAVGLLLFFPSFLLGAGGPPPHVMGSVVKPVAGPLPLTRLTNAVRAPWLGLGPATGSLIGVAVLAVAASAVAARRTAL